MFKWFMSLYLSFNCCFIWSWYLKRHCWFYKKHMWNVNLSVVYDGDAYTVLDRTKYICQPFNNSLAFIWYDLSMYSSLNCRWLWNHKPTGGQGYLFKSDGSVCLTKDWWVTSHSYFQMICESKPISLFCSVHPLNLKDYLRILMTKPLLALFVLRTFQGTSFRWC